MSTNEIIRAFDINAITADNINLYLSFTIDRQKAASKGAKYIKVCIDTTENVNTLVRDFNDATRDDVFLDELSFSFKSKSSPKGLNLYKFEDNLLDLTINEDEVTVFKEYPIAINRNKVQIIVKPTVTSIEKPHTFKVYILNKNKSILEKYSWPSSYDISEYTTTEEGDVLLFSSLESSLDLILTPYDVYYNRGPYLKVDNQILDNTAINFENIKLEIIYREKSYEFTNSQTINDSFNRVQSASNPAQLADPSLNLNLIEEFISRENIERYEKSVFYRNSISKKMLDSNNRLIQDIYEIFVSNLLTVDNIRYKIIYNNNQEITKEKQLDKTTVESLYDTYFKKNKDIIVNKSFREKINIQSLPSQEGSKISFKQYDKKLLPVGGNQLRIKIFKIVNGQENPVENIYTNTAFDEDSKITAYNNQGFLLESFYERPDSSTQFYIKKSSNTTTELFRVYIDNTIIYEASVTNDVLSPTRNTNDLLRDYSRPLDLDTQINDCFINPSLISPNTIGFDFDEKKVDNIIATAAKYGYLTNNNENLTSQIINNTILLCKVTNSAKRIDCMIPIRLKNSQRENTFILNLPFSVGFNETIEIDLKSLMLPNGMCDKLISNSGSDDDKEEIFEYLNLISPTRYVAIDRLIRTMFFNSLQELTVVSSIFNIVGNDLNSSSFLIRESLNLRELLENVRQLEDISGI